MSRSLCSVAAVVALLVAAHPAHADCPTPADDPVCQRWTALVLPTVFGQVYVPHGIEGAYLGGGLEVAVLAWNHNSPAFGPGQGRVRLDLSGLDPTANRAPSIAMYRAGVQLSFERNAARDYAIPFFALDFGGLWVGGGINRRWFVDGGLGLYLLHRRSMTLDLEVTGLVPRRDPSTLGGTSTRLGLTYALW